MVVLLLLCYCTSFFVAVVSHSWFVAWLPGSGAAETRAGKSKNEERFLRVFASEGSNGDIFFVELSCFVIYFWSCFVVVLFPLTLTHLLCASNFFRFQWFHSVSVL